MTLAEAPEALRIEREWRAALLVEEQGTMTKMSGAYLDIATRLEAEFEALAEQVARMAAEDVPISIGKLYQLERFQRMAARIDAEFGPYREYAAGLISSDQEHLLTAGNAFANEQLAAAGFAATTEGFSADAVAQMVGQTQGGPLSALLYGAVSSAETASALANVLVQGTALGHNPAVVAREMSDAFDLPLSRSLCIARTEMLGAHRAATLESYRQAGVAQWEWLTAQDDGVCIACMAAEGELFDVYEEPAMHPNCRCALLPYYEGATAFPMGQEWFDSQDKETQLSIMGPGRLTMYREAKAAEDQGAAAAELWSRFADMRSDPVWGGAVVPTTIEKLKEGGGGLADYVSSAPPTPLAPDLAPTAV